MISKRKVQNCTRLLYLLTNSSSRFRVADIHYLDCLNINLQIHAEHFQKVTHNLLGIKGFKNKGHIKTVRSHSQAIGQCSKIILENKLKANNFC